MINKKRVFIFGAFLICLFFLMTFAGGRNEEVAMKTVEFIDGFNNETISLQEVEVGEDAEVPEEPVHENYVFAGWYLYEDQDVRITDFTEILEDLTVIGKYADDKNNNGIADDVDDYYNVVFVDSVDNTIISTQTVLEGLDATAPFAPIHNGFTFVGWSRGYTNVRENITVNALYILNEEAAGNEVVLYEVTFIDGENDEVIEVQEVQEGLAATLPEPPVHENRVFDHWEGEYEEIVEDTEITAIYVDDLNNNGIADSIEPHYDVIYEDYDGTVLEIFEEVLVDSETPVIASPTREYYEFESWTPELAETVTEEVTYRATYAPINDENKDGVADEEQARVVFEDYNGEELYNNLVTIGEATPEVEEPTREYYEFESWTPELAETVTEEVTYRATYAPINDENNDGIADEEQARVVFEDYNGEELYNNLVTIGETTPEVEEPTREYYEFESWTPELAETVTEEVTYRATYAPINDENNDGIADEEQFTVTYNDYNNEIIKSFTYVTKGEETPVIDNPTREFYEFEGWTPEVEEFVTGNVTYTATYAPINDVNGDGIADEEQFTVTYNDYNNELIRLFTYVTKGDVTPIIPNPTRENYKFTGWTPVVEEFVTGNATYTATYAPVNDVNGDGIADEEQFTVTYNDYNSELIKLFTYVTKGKETPVIANPTRENYEFTGWTPEVEEFVTGNVTYTATYAPINDVNCDGIADEEQFTVTYNDYNNELIRLFTYVTKGDVTPIIPNPTRENYKFTGWTPEVEEFVTGNVTYTASYAPVNDANNDGIADEEQFTVTYNDYNNELIKSFTYVTKGKETPVIANPTRENYEFTGWTPEVEEFITGNATYKATYAPINDANNDGIADEEQFTVTYNDYNNELIESFTYVTKGEETPTIANPTRENYEFTGWTPSVEEFVTGNITYTATYAPINDANNDGVADEEQARVIFKAENGEELYNNLVTIGETTPTVENPLKEGYSFTGWNNAETNVVGIEPTVTKDVTYIATYIDNIAPTINANTTLYNEDQNAAIYATVTDVSGINTVKVLKGNHEASAFEGNGTELTIENGVYTLNGITKNGVYTIYVEDNNGNATVKTIEVEGIIVLEGDFEDLYATGSFGSLRTDGWVIISTYRRNLSVTTKQNVKIADARVYVGNSYATVEKFENDKNFGTSIEHTNTSLTYDIAGSFLQRVTIYVNYEYQEEVAPGVFETKNISKLYKTRLTYLFGD